MDKFLLTQAATEITQLRQTNNILSAKVQMFDDMMLLFKARPPEYGMGSKPDVVYNLNKAVHEMEMAEKAPTSDQAINPLAEKMKQLNKKDF